jgi:hypothetical protein
LRFQTCRLLIQFFGVAEEALSIRAVNEGERQALGSLSQIPAGRRLFREIRRHGVRP